MVETCSIFVFDLALLLFTIIHASSTFPGTFLKLVGGSGGWSKVTLVFCFDPKPKFSSFDLDFDQAEQNAKSKEFLNEDKAGRCL